MPKRIQMKRTKGWHKPEGVIYVGRPTKWGNPFTAANAIESGFATKDDVTPFLVECFEDWLGPSQRGRDWWQGPESDKRKAAIISGILELRGKDLGCWCPLGVKCHADVLIKLANQ